MDNDGSTSLVTFNSSKTQTVCTAFNASSSIDASTAFNDVIYRNQSQHCQTSNTLEELYQSQHCQTSIQAQSSMVEDLYRSQSQRCQTESSIDVLDSLRCQMLGESQGELIHMETQTADEEPLINFN